MINFKRFMPALALPALALPALALPGLALLAFGLAALAGIGSAAAQSYPTRPIRLIVAFPPGGSTDLIARVVGQPLGQRLGQAIVVENRPGSNGNIAADVVAKADPDGYMLLLAPDSLFGINPHLYAHMSLDPFKAFVPIANLVTNQLVLAVNAKLVPVHTLREFVAFARNANPSLPYASIGNGSQHHLAMEMLKQRAGINLLHVPYRGGGPAAYATIAGDTVAMFAGGAVVPLIKQGKLRGLAVTATHRSPSLPDLPTIAEDYPGYELTLWQGLFAPAGTPQPIIDKLRANVEAVLKMPEVAERFRAAGAGEPSFLTMADFTALMRRDDEKYGKLISDLGLTVN
jgi:tripartite-type tricarboxylate transporter receptor subunit TctC